MKNFKNREWQSLVSDLYEKRMHIAVSRALSLLRIVGVEGEIRKDYRLAEFV